MKTLAQTDPQVYQVIQSETERETTRLQMIASENYASSAVLEAQGSVFTNKYAEGYPSARYYQGCGPSDAVEQMAIDRVLHLFGGDHANVQPHSGSTANMAAYMALLNPGDRVLGMDLAAGGHLTHGAKANFSGKLYQVQSYTVDPATCRLDYDAVRAAAREFQPRLIVAGASAYPRTIDFAAFRAIADEVGAFLLADIAHLAGLIAGGAHPSPIPHADIVTSTTHKTLRGPRGGFVICRAAHAKKVNSVIFPGIQGGPLMHVVAAKAVAFHEAAQADFKAYANQVVVNARALAETLMENGIALVTGGTDNHLVLLDLRSIGMTGAEAAGRLEAAGIVAHNNRHPYDPLPPRTTSGVRLGTPAITTRGMKEPEMKIIGGLINRVLRGSGDAGQLEAVRAEVQQLCAQFPMFDYGKECQSAAAGRS